MKIQKTKNTSMLIALLLVLMAGSVGVQADGSDPLDPSDGGADWEFRLGKESRRLESLSEKRD